MGNLLMTPAAGERLLRFAGDALCFNLSSSDSNAAGNGWKALVRTNVGRSALWRKEIVKRHFERLQLQGAYWCDIPMQPADGGWSLTLCLTETGYFEAKAYA